MGKGYVGGRCGVVSAAAVPAPGDAFFGLGGGGGGAGSDADAGVATDGRTAEARGVDGAGADAGVGMGLGTEGRVWPPPAGACVREGGVGKGVSPARYVDLTGIDRLPGGIAQVGIDCGVVLVAEQAKRIGGGQAWGHVVGQAPGEIILHLMQNRRH